MNASPQPEKLSAFGGEPKPLSKLYPSEYAPFGTLAPSNPGEDANTTDIEPSAVPTTIANAQAAFHRSELGEPIAPDEAALAWVDPIRKALAAAQPPLTPDRTAYAGGVGELLNEGRYTSAAEYAGSALDALTLSSGYDQVQAAVQESREDSPVQQEPSPPES